MEEYGKIKNRREEFLNAGKIMEYTKCTITDMAGKVLKHIAEKYKNAREGIQEGSVMEFNIQGCDNKGM